MFLTICAIAEANIYSDLDSLDYYLTLKSSYDLSKNERIEQLRIDSSLCAYKRYSLLFEEYASYNYDSAHYYVDRLVDESALSGDRNRIALSQIRKGFTYLSAGMFKEACDQFEDMSDLISEIPAQSAEDKSVLLKYYSTYARLMYDLADYDRGELYYSYVSEGNRLTEESLDLMTCNDTSSWFYAMAVRDMKEGNYVRSMERFLLQLQSSSVTEHEKAISYSSLGYICGAMGKEEESLHYNALAAISDIKNSTKEAVALREVAMTVFRMGMTDRALRYIRYAEEDARFYNARHRQLEISQILPIIEKAEQNLLENHGRKVRRLTMILYALILILLCAFVVIYNRQRATRRAHATIEEMNNNLMEVNRIKEEYISTFLCMQTDMVNQLEQYQRWVKKRAQDKRCEELQSIPHQYNASRTRKEFYKQFDEMLLRIFPDFVEHFNSLLRPEERFVLPKGELLNTELRIFALIRLGVSDNEKIAQILDYSVNTIYTYKTRVRNKSSLSTEEFNNAVMKI